LRRADSTPTQSGKCGLSLARRRGTRAVVTRKCGHQQKNARLMQNKYRPNPDESPPIDLRANTEAAAAADKRTRAETPLDFFVSPPDPAREKHFLPLSQRSA